MFDQPESAEEAMSVAQGFELFDKPMKISLARTRSDKTVEINCSEKELEEHKLHRQEEKSMASPTKLLRHSADDIETGKRQAAEAADEQKRKRAAPAPTENRPSKIARPSGLKSTGAGSAAVVPDEYLPPNKILFLQNMPEDYDTDALSPIFSRFEGFREIRLVPGRRGIAFVEYESEQGAIAAKDNTAGMTLGDKVLKVTYQRQ